MKLCDIFKNNVKYFRFQKGFTQEQLGSVADLSPRYISSIETGKFSPPFDTIERLANALGIEAFELFRFNKNTINIVPRIDDYNRNLSK